RAGVSRLFDGISLLQESLGARRKTAKSAKDSPRICWLREAVEVLPTVPPFFWNRFQYATLWSMRASLAHAFVPLVASAFAALACDSAESHFGEDSGGSSGSAGRGGSSTAGSAGKGGSATGGLGGASGSAGTVATGGTAGTIVVGEHGCTPGRLTTIGELRGRYGILTPTIDDRQYFLQMN